MIIGLTLVTFNTQGIRYNMWPCIVTSWTTVIFWYLCVHTFTHVLFIYFNGFGFLLSVSLFLAYGDGTFAKCEITGKFQVGHKVYHVKKNECAVSVWYPIEPEAAVYRKYWLDYRSNDASIRGLKEGRVW